MKIFKTTFMAILFSAAVGCSSSPVSQNISDVQCTQSLFPWFTNEDRAEYDVNLKSPYIPYNQFSMSLIKINNLFDQHDLCMECMKECQDYDNLYLLCSMSFFVRGNIDYTIQECLLTSKEPNSVLEEFLTQTNRRKISLYLLTRFNESQEEAYSLFLEMVVYIECKDMSYLGKNKDYE